MTTEHFAEIVNLAPPDKAAHRCEVTTSDAYTFLPTEVISAALMERGWGVSSVVTTKTKSPYRKGFQKHMVRYRNQDQMLKIGDRTAELLMVNAHDGTCTYQFKGGIFEFICSNGLIVCSKEFPGIKVVHMGTSLRQVIDASMEVADKLPMLVTQVNMMEAIGMTPNEREQFARQAIELRFGQDSPITPDLVLNARRLEDTPQNLWKTLNVVQENLMKGGFYAPHRAGGWQPVKAIKGMEMNLKVNEGLWELAAGMIR